MAKCHIGSPAIANGDGDGEWRQPAATGPQPCCARNLTSFPAVADNCAWLGNTMQS